MDVSSMYDESDDVESSHSTVSRSDGEDFIIAEIIRQRTYRTYRLDPTTGRSRVMAIRQFLTRWEGYSDQYNTWQFAEDISPADPVFRAYLKSIGISYETACAAIPTRRVKSTTSKDATVDGAKSPVSAAAPALWPFSAEGDRVPAQDYTNPSEDTTFTLLRGIGLARRGGRRAFSSKSTCASTSSSTSASAHSSTSAPASAAPILSHTSRRSTLPSRTRPPSSRGPSGVFLPSSSHLSPASSSSSTSSSSTSSSSTSSSSPASSTSSTSSSPSSSSSPSNTTPFMSPSSPLRFTAPPLIPATPYTNTTNISGYTISTGMSTTAISEAAVIDAQLPHTGYPTSGSLKRRRPQRSPSRRLSSLSADALTTRSAAQHNIFQAASTTAPLGLHAGQPGPQQPLVIEDDAGRRVDRPTREVVAKIGKREDGEDMEDGEEEYEEGEKKRERERKDRHEGELGEREHSWTHKRRKGSSVLGDRPSEKECMGYRRGGDSGGDACGDRGVGVTMEDEDDVIIISSSPSPTQPPPITTISRRKTTATPAPPEKFKGRTPKERKTTEPGKLGTAFIPKYKPHPKSLAEVLFNLSNSLHHKYARGRTIPPRTQYDGSAGSRADNTDEHVDNRNNRNTDSGMAELADDRVQFVCIPVAGMGEVALVMRYSLIPRLFAEDEDEDEEGEEQEKVSESGGASAVGGLGDRGGASDNMSEEGTDVDVVTTGCQLASYADTTADGNTNSSTIDTTTTCSTSSTTSTASSIIAPASVYSPSVPVYSPVHSDGKDVSAPLPRDFRVFATCGPQLMALGRRTMERFGSIWYRAYSNSDRVNASANGNNSGSTSDNVGAVGGSNGSGSAGDDVNRTNMCEKAGKSTQKRFSSNFRGENTDGNS